MAPRLVLSDGSGRREVPLPEGTTTAAGRGPAGNGIRLEERNVSRRHACFHAVDGTVTVEDLGSRTGTFVNGERISAPRRLRPGDRVRIGDFELRLSDGEARAPEPAAATTSTLGLPPPIPNRFTPHAPGTAPAPSSLRKLASAAARAVDAVVPRRRRR